jgi:hypothetical protein
VITGQLSLELAPPKPAERWPWTGTWDWEPSVGGICEVHRPIVPLADGSGEQYAYMERCVILEMLPNDVFIVEVRMSQTDWRWKDQAPDTFHEGLKLRLGRDEIWPRYQDLQDHGS